MTRPFASNAVAMLAVAVLTPIDAGLSRAAGVGTSSTACPATGAIAEAKGPFSLKAEQTISLQAVCDRREMTERLRSLGRDRRYLLVAGDLRASVQPGTPFRLRLGRAKSGKTTIVGSINFFAARRPDASGPPRSISFDVTSTIRALLASGWPAQGLSLAIEPSGAVAPNADDTVGTITLVAQ
jgi:hypothetical protein